MNSKGVLIVLLLVLLVSLSGCTKKYVCGNGIIEEGETKENCCQDVGCKTYFSCQKDGRCIQNVYHYPDCRGFVCDGFCYTGVEEACLNDQLISGIVPIAENQTELEGFLKKGVKSGPCNHDLECNQGACFFHKCQNKPPADFDIISLDYPRSIPLNTNFQLKLTLKNKKDFEVNIKNLYAIFIGDPGGFLGLVSEDILSEYQVDNTILAPQEERIITLNLKSPSYTSPDAEIYGSVNFIYDFASNPIIVYDANKETLHCGNKIYNKDQGICVDGILYPLKGNKYCISNSDCPEGFACFEHFCMKGLVYKERYDDFGVFRPDKYYRIAVLPLYISNNPSEIEEQKNRIPLEYNKEIRKANEWFAEEKQYWRIADDFILHFELVDCNVEFGREELIQVLDSVSEKSVSKVIHKTIEQCLIDRDRYPIVAVKFVFPGLIITTDEYGGEHIESSDEELDTKLFEKGFVVGWGLALDDVVYIVRFHYLTLLHEVLHTFGLPDIYPKWGMYGARFQWSDCYMMRAHGYTIISSGLWTHLCPLEAFVLEWTHEWTHDAYWEREVEGNKIKNYVCLNGAVVYDRKVCTSVLGSEYISIACHSDADCYDANESTFDVCQNPGALGSYCEWYPIP